MRASQGYRPGGEPWVSAPLGHLPGDEAARRPRAGGARDAAPTTSDQLVSFLIVCGSVVLVVEMVVALNLFG